MLAKRLDLWRLSNFRLERLASLPRTSSCSTASRTTTLGTPPLRPGRGPRPDARAGSGGSDVPVARSDGAAMPCRDARGPRAVPAPGSSGRRTGSCSMSGRAGTCRARAGPTSPAPSRRSRWAPTSRRCSCASGHRRSRRVPAQLGPRRAGRRRPRRHRLERESPTDPVRPLTPYRQKVLVAQRFGVPYPFEIIRMLTARPGASADFPPARSSSTTSKPTVTSARSTGSRGSTPRTSSSVSSPTARRRSPRG